MDEKGNRMAWAGSESGGEVKMYISLTFSKWSPPASDREKWKELGKAFILQWTSNG